MKQLRERLQHDGAQALSDQDLLTLVLQTGSLPPLTPEQIAAVLAEAGGLHGLRQMGPVLFMNRFGPAKTAQVQALLELTRRLQLPAPAKYQITCPDDAARLVMPLMAHLDHEEMRILVLDTGNQVVANTLLYKGTVNCVLMRAAEVYRSAIARNGLGVVVCHNHMSGSLEASDEDLQSTEQLVAAGRLLGIDLVDHLIIGNHTYLSLKERLRW